MVVSNDSVVDEGDSFLVIEMGVSVHIGFVTMGRPSRVTDSDQMVVLIGAINDHALDAVAAKTVSTGKLGALEGGLVVRGLVLVDRDDSTRIVPTTFKNLQALDANLTSLGSVSQVADNTAALVLLCRLSFSHLIIQVAHGGHGGEKHHSLVGSPHTSYSSSSLLQHRRLKHAKRFLKHCRYFKLNFNWKIKN